MLLNCEAGAIPEPVVRIAEENALEIIPYTVDLDYDYWTAGTVND